MDVPEWYFGPPGDLRPLPSPEPDVMNTVERFGGVHTALTGGRTVDTIGYRASYEFELNHLEPQDYFWLESLHTQTIPGPFKLIDPLRKNLLSREASMAKPADASRKGVTPTGYSTVRWIRETDSPASWAQRVAEWSGLGITRAAPRLEIDAGTPVPVRINQPITVSAYIRPTAAVTLFWELIPQDATGTPQKATQSQTATLEANEWVRIAYTHVPEIPTVSLYPVLHYLQGATTTDRIQVAIPQVEYGAVSTDPALGGGSVTVGIDALTTSSPRYPLQSVTLKLLEV